jgi:phenylalanyl-tRNA synthetase beta chain
MRLTIIPSLLDIVSKGYRVKGEGHRFKIFEVAKTYIKSEHVNATLGSLKGKQSNMLANLPTQDLKIAITLVNSNFLEIKGLVENLLDLLKRKATFSKLPSVILERSQVPYGTRRSDRISLSDPDQSAQVKVADQPVGTFGILRPGVAAHFSLDTNVAIAELNLTTIYQLPATSNQYRPIPNFPPIIEDISAIFSVNTPVADIIAEVKKASDLLKTVEIIDIFEDPKLGEAKKSITFRLTYQKSSGTPTQEEVTVERQKISKVIEANLRAKVRK